jgi:hypothetical protein
MPSSRVRHGRKELAWNTSNAVQSSSEVATQLCSRYRLRRSSAARRHTARSLRLSLQGHAAPRLNDQHAR